MFFVTSIVIFGYCAVIFFTFDLILLQAPESYLHSSIHHFIVISVCIINDTEYVENVKTHMVVGMLGVIGMDNSSRAYHKVPQWNS